MDDKVKEYAKERIKQIKLIQKDLDNLKIRLKKNECFPKDEILNSLARMDARLSLGTAITLLQDLSSVYERELQGKSMKWKSIF